MYDINKQERMIYRNGVKLNVINPIITPLNCNHVLKIGTRFQNNIWYNGNIDDLRVYTGRVLNQAQINELYALVFYEVHLAVIGTRNHNKISTL